MSHFIHILLSLTCICVVYSLYMTNKMVDTLLTETVQLWESHVNMSKKLMELQKQMAVMEATHLN